MKRRGGFTLFELLAVITIIGIVLAVTLGSFHGWGDAQAVRGSAEVVEAALAHARDYAVSHRVPVRFQFQTGVTNELKRTAEYLLAQESDMAVATNRLTLSQADETMQLLGSLQRLPGGAWLFHDVPVTSEADTYDRFVFLPNGKVINPQTEGHFRLFVVSRRRRGAGTTPSIIYRIDLDPATGGTHVTKINSEDVH